MSRVRSLYDRRMAVTCSLIVLYVCSSTVASVLLIVRLPTIISSNEVELWNRKPTGTGSQQHFLQLDAPAQSTSATRVILLYSLLLRLVSAPISFYTTYMEITDHHVHYDRNSLLSTPCHHEWLHSNPSRDPLARKHLLRINRDRPRILHYQHFHSVFERAHHRIGLYHLRTLRLMYTAYPLTPRNSRTLTQSRRSDDIDTRNFVFLQGGQKSKQELFAVHDACAVHRRTRATSLAEKGSRCVRPISGCQKHPLEGTCVRVLEHRSSICG